MKEKWGQALNVHGFQAVPNLLLLQQGAMGITSTEMVVLLHLNRSWWRREKTPYPRPARIAQKMGVHRRTVERCLASLETKKLIERQEPRRNRAGLVVRPISLVRLADRLESIAPPRLKTRDRTSLTGRPQDKGLQREQPSSRGTGERADF